MWKYFSKETVECLTGKQSKDQHGTCYTEKLYVNMDWLVWSNEIEGHI